ncbi:hypothetical protein L6260_02555 [Candidatus Parcubacteria bacterium]|nr:hypothetical protein [Patescibacteria group bacterium]MCG2687661.1 hypothetical protein [Candidatus Parcubacteria bacterium]
MATSLAIRFYYFLGSQSIIRPQGGVMRFPEDISVLVLTHRCAIANGAGIVESLGSEQHCFTSDPLLALRWFVERHARGDPFDAVVFELAVIPQGVEHFLHGVRVLSPKTKIIVLVGARSTHAIKVFACDYHSRLAGMCDQTVWDETELAKALEILEPVSYTVPDDQLAQLELAS